MSDTAFKLGVGFCNTYSEVTITIGYCVMAVEFGVDDNGGHYSYYSGGLQA
jgi:hypothetical protein